jgi:hypothetical protein
MKPDAGATDRPLYRLLEPHPPPLTIGRLSKSNPGATLPIPPGVIQLLDFLVCFIISAVLKKERFKCSML